MLRYIFIFCLSFKAFGQQEKIDSLLGVFNSNQHDTIRLEAMYTIANEVEPKEFPGYCQKMMALAEKCLKKTDRRSFLYQKYIHYIVEGYYLKGVFASDDNLHDSALIFYDKAIAADINHKNEEAITYCELSKANIYITRGLYPISTTLLYRSLKYFEKCNNYEGMGDVYFHIGRLYTAQSNHRKSIEFLEKAYANYKRAGNTVGMIDMLYKMTDINLALKNDSEAIKCANKSIQLCIKEDADHNRQTINANLGLIAWINKDYKKLIYYYEKCVAMAKESNRTHLLGHRHIYLGWAYYYEHNYNKAIVNATIAMDLAVKTKNIEGQQANAYLLSNIYEKIKDYSSALKYSRLQILLSDSLKRTQYNKLALEKHLQYEYEKKELVSKTNHEKEILKLSLESERKNDRKNIGIFVLIACFLVTLIIVYFLYKSQRQKNTIAVQSSNLLRQKMLLSQMNPHFVFNSINSIQSFILDKKEKEAYSYLAKFSKLIRMVLNNTEQLIIPLFQEIDLLKTYVELEQLRFENVFMFELTVDEGLEEQSLYVPPMLIQPYVENAIWHGLMNLNDDRPGKLSVRFSIENGLLKIIVEDNGIGRARAGLFERDAIHKPVAMKLTEKRLRMINKAWGQNGIKVSVHDLYDDNKQATGTRVELYLPLDFQENERT